jgi:hypothetical protein
VIQVAGATVAASNGSWATAAGPVTSDSVYNGESYDARKELPGWATPSYAPTAAWTPAAVTSGPGGALTPIQMPTVSVDREVRPVSVKSVGGNWVVDFGENLSGWCRLAVSGAAGTTVTLHHAEVLQHPPYGPADGSVYVGNLRSALATDTYTLTGRGVEVYEPHFTYHGFQFVQVVGYPGVLTADNITMVHFHTLLTVKSTFNSSSNVLNAIQANCVSGQASNMMTVPTDCDQRDERLVCVCVCVCVWGGVFDVGWLRVLWHMRVYVYTLCARATLCIGMHVVVRNMRTKPAVAAAVGVARVRVLTCCTRDAIAGLDGRRRPVCGHHDTQL